MKRIKFALLFLFFVFGCLNFYQLIGQGNFSFRFKNLIPSKTNSIELEKQHISISKVSSYYFRSSVEYHLFNSGKTEEVELLFDVEAPQYFQDNFGEEGAYKRLRFDTTQHIGIKNFSIRFNNVLVPYKVYITEGNIENGSNTFNLITGKEFTKQVKALNNEKPFFYVYSLKIKLKSGLNILKHSYLFYQNSTPSNSFWITYMLNKNSGWRNDTIKDFKLTVDLGVFEQFKIINTFYRDSKDWTLNGSGKLEDRQVQHTSNAEGSILVSMEKGSVQYKKSNFVFNDENLLVIVDASGYEKKIFDQKDILHYKKNAELTLKGAIDLEALSILKFLPYAKRGCTSKNEAISNYYNGLNWYQPNINIREEAVRLTAKEINWLKSLFAK